MRSLLVLLLDEFSQEASMSKKVESGDSVSIHYTGKLADGTVFDSSEGREPLPFVAGAENIISGMSAAVIGMSEGEKKTVEIPAAEAYGERNEELLVQVPLDRVPEGVKVGDLLSDGRNEGLAWTVRDIDAENVVLDGNHPLAGQTLIFDIELVSVG